MRELLRQRLTKEYNEFSERCKNATTNGECDYSLYERFAKEEIECSFAVNTTLSDEKISELLALNGCLLDHLYDVFFRGEDAFAIAVQEKLDQSLQEVKPIKSF